jgi:hypothetical protein
MRIQYAIDQKSLQDSQNMRKYGIFGVPMANSARNSACRRKPRGA